MSGWIKFWKDMADDPRLIEAAALLSRNYVFGARSAGGGCDLSPGDSLRFASNALRGALVTLWCYADEHIRNDDTLPLRSDTLDAFVGIEGFFAMMPRAWISELDDGTVKLPGYCEKNSVIAKGKRAADNKARQAAWRARQGKSNGVDNGAHTQSVTRNKPVTKCVDLDSTKTNTKTNTRSDHQEVSSATPTVVTEPRGTSAIVRVFEHWQQVWQRPKAVLDGKRRKLIADALKTHSEADVCMAIAGYRNSPHHTGTNDRDTVYDDISLFLRDTKHIEDGIKFHTNPPRTGLSSLTRQNADATADWQPPELRHAASGV